MPSFRVFQLYTEQSLCRKSQGKNKGFNLRLYKEFENRCCEGKGNAESANAISGWNRPIVGRQNGMMSVQLVFFQHAVKRATADAQFSGCAGNVSAGFLQGLLQGLLDHVMIAAWGVGFFVDLFISMS